MKKMNKKGFTLVELLAVIVILAILMAIAATNIGPVIDNSRRSSMRTTAQQIIDGVRLQLTSNYELFPGTYGFTKAILDSGGVSAPFGGEYSYYEGGDDSKRIGSGVYNIDSNTPDVKSACSSATYSYVVVKRDAATSNYEWSICLTTKDDTTTGGANPPGGYLAATRTDLDNKDETSIFHGRASIGGESTQNGD